MFFVFLSRIANLAEKTQATHSPGCFFTKEISDHGSDQILQMQQQTRQVLFTLCFSQGKCEFHEFYDNYLHGNFHPCTQMNKGGQNKNEFQQIFRRCFLRKYLRNMSFAICDTSFNRLMPSVQGIW
jgi:hypothetical protein